MRGWLGLQKPNGESGRSNMVYLSFLRGRLGGARLQRQFAGYKLLIIDELGYVPLSQTGAELLFEVFSQRYERGSTIVTSNLPFIKTPLSLAIALDGSCLPLDHAFEPRTRINARSSGGVRHSASPNQSRPMRTSTTRTIRMTPMTPMPP